MLRHQEFRSFKTSSREANSEPSSCYSGRNGDHRRSDLWSSHAQERESSSGLTGKRPNLLHREEQDFLLELRKGQERQDRVLQGQTAARQQDLQSPLEVLMECGERKTSRTPAPPPKVVFLYPQVRLVISSKLWHTKANSNRGGMSFNKKTVKDVNLKGKRVLMRADYNVPVSNGVISDDYRIKQSLPTIEYILNEGARTAPG
jgi:hypothetical protein